VSDSEILELERRIETGDLEAWPLFDAALRRVGLPPRRIWVLYLSGGEYSDSWETTLEPVHTTKEGAVRHMGEFVASEKGRELGLQPDPADPEEYHSSSRSRARLRIYWSPLADP